MRCSPAFGRSTSVDHSSASTSGVSGLNGHVAIRVAVTLTDTGKAGAANCHTSAVSSSGVPSLVTVIVQTREASGAIAPGTVIGSERLRPVSVPVIAVRSTDCRKAFQISTVAVCGVDTLPKLTAVGWMWIRS